MKEIREYLRANVPAGHAALYVHPLEEEPALMDMLVVLGGFTEEQVMAQDEAADYRASAFVLNARNLAMQAIVGIDAAAPPIGAAQRVETSEAPLRPRVAPPSDTDRPLLDVHTIHALARIAHETNRAYCLSIGDASQPPWDSAPEWAKQSAVKGVLGVLQGNGPGESHAGWMQERLAAGWVYGEVKDVEKKTHPCLVPYEQLPPEQRKKDALFVTVVAAAGLVFARPV